jgi:hypothetical protein
MKMKKKIISSLLAGAFGVALLAPATYAWDSPVETRAKIWEDRQDMRRDMAVGNYRGAQHEQAEIARREARLGYYNGGYYYPRAYTWAPAPAYSYGYGYRHHHHHHHDDD